MAKETRNDAPAYVRVAGKFTRPQYRKLREFAAREDMDLTSVVTQAVAELLLKKGVKL